MRDGTRNKPSELVALTESTFVSVWVTVICAPGTTAPVGSVTLPDIMPVLFCANIGIASRKARAISPISRLRKFFSFFGNSRYAKKWPPEAIPVHTSYDQHGHRR